MMMLVAPCFKSTLLVAPAWRMMLVRVSWKMRKKVVFRSWSSESSADVGMNIAFDAGARLKFVGLPFEGRDEAEMIENAGPQFGGDAADESGWWNRCGRKSPGFFQKSGLNPWAAGWRARRGRVCNR